MTKITELNIYPIKSCRGISLQCVEIAEYGLKWDRNWMLVDAAQRNFLTQRELPRLACIETAITDHSLHVSIQGAPPLNIAFELDRGKPQCHSKIWRDWVQTYDEGDEAAQWFSSALGRSVRLLRFDPDYRRHCDSQWTQENSAHTRFSDAYPILITNPASLDDLNERLQTRQQAAVPMDRFRPNIVLEGLPPYEEDYVDTLRIDNIVLKCVKPSPRCSVPSVNQQTGLPQGDEPLATLSTYRMHERAQGAVFGQNTIVLQGVGHTLRVGATLAVDLNF